MDTNIFEIGCIVFGSMLGGLGLATAILIIVGRINTKKFEKKLHKHAEELMNGGNDDAERG